MTSRGRRNEIWYVVAYNGSEMEKDRNEDRGYVDKPTPTEYRNRDHSYLLMYMKRHETSPSQYKTR